MEMLADSINEEPIVWMDCTSFEITCVLAVCIPTCLVLGIIAGVAMGFVLVGLIMGLLLCLGAVYGILHWLKSIRQRYYATWLKEQVLIAKADWHFSKPLFMSSRRFGREG